LELIAVTAAEDAILSVAAEDLIPPSAGANEVIAAPALDLIGSAPRSNDVASRGTDDLVRATRAEDRGIHAVALQGANARTCTDGVDERSYGNDGCCGGNLHSICSQFPTHH
jgi:hypothetical protein